MTYKIVIDRRAAHDIIRARDYYNEQQKGLGKRFAKEVDKRIKNIAANPAYQIRYDDVRCFPLSKFPFMIHFSVNDSLRQIEIHAVIHTSLNPDVSWIKR